MGIIDKVYTARERERLQIREDALKDAGRIAGVMGRRFKAKKVILYGSLSKGRYFDIASDIDIAVDGLGHRYFKAYGYCIRLSKFNLDIKAYEDMPSSLKQKIDKEGICLYGKKGN